MRLDRALTIRLDGERINRLDRLAEVTERSRGAVIRLLLDAARITEMPDIGLIGTVPEPAAHGEHQRQPGADERQEERRD